jgi:cyclopropane fatty-acyl-phospholipid synthase-like methyltransferase
MESNTGQNIDEFISQFKNSITQHEFVKLTLSKPVGNERNLSNVYIRLINIKQTFKVSFTYRYKTNDQVKNFELEEAVIELTQLLKNSFKLATLFTIKTDLLLMISKNGKVSIKNGKATFTQPVSESHDREKKKRATHQDVYLHLLGITDEVGIVIPKMADKYKQINKYLEIIEGLIKEANLPEEVNVVDMGSGKGYLTFALYDFLHNKLGLKVRITGIELREELVSGSNAIAAQCGFENLNFECKSIEAFGEKRFDILIALHACDTATDDAIKKGITSHAALIICAPCCHKQIRQQLKGKEQKSAILKYGIFKERQCEMVTDTLRALIMEKKKYETKIFEFISNEHTRKNIMLVGMKSSKKIDEKMINEQIENIKKEYGIEYHYLEKLLEE